MNMLLIAVIFGATFLFLRSKTAKKANPTLLRCSACKAEMTRHAWGTWWLVGEWSLWIAFVTLTQLGQGLPTGYMILLAIVVSIAWVTARDRLYHSYWTWRHPVRCESGGHAQPEPERA